MELIINYRNEKKCLQFDKEKIKARNILEAMDLSPVYAFIVINGELASEDDVIHTDDKIEVINAISGG